MTATKAYYTNKNYARKAMTILVERMVMFETVERKESSTLHGHELGVKFSAGNQEYTFYPTDESDVNEIRSLIH